MEEINKMNRIRINLEVPKKLTAKLSNLLRTEKSKANSVDPHEVAHFEPPRGSF